jgi:hypothetical protein
MAPKEPVDPTAMKIVNQYFHRNVRVCELAGAAGVIDVHVSQADDSSWVVEVHSKRADDAVVIVGSGTTSAAALTAASTEWAAQADYLGLKAFNWKSVAEALHMVQAIK